MTKQQIREWLAINRGSSKKLAAELGIYPSGLSMWLSGKSPSRPLDKKVPGLVRKMMAAKQKGAGAQAHA